MQTLIQIKAVCFLCCHCEDENSINRVAVRQWDCIYPKFSKGDECGMVVMSSSNLDRVSFCGVTDGMWAAILCSFSSIFSFYVAPLFTKYNTPCVVMLFQPHKTPTLLHSSLGFRYLSKLHSASFTNSHKTLLYHMWPDNKTTLRLFTPFYQKSIIKEQT